MVLYTNNLYERIIVKEARKFSVLRIISGYGSAPFLKKVANEFSHLHIELYIGMTFQGVSQKNHEGYCGLMRESNNITVYYQVEGIQNHMKIIEFKSTIKTKTFIGSANFTENGFINQRELMSEVDEETDELFDYQAELSLKANTDKINDYITFFEEEYIISNEESHIEHSEGKEDNTDLSLKNSDKDLSTISETGSREYRSLLSSMRSSANPAFFKRFDIEIVLDNENNPRWSDTGINSWVDGKKPVLSQTPRVLFDKVFPTDRTVEIFTDDGNRYQGKLTGRFNGNFVLIDGDLYDYVRKRIGLKELRSISREDLVTFGWTQMHFERIDEAKYFMSFGWND